VREIVYPEVIEIQQLRRPKLRIIAALEALNSFQFYL